MKKDAIEIRPDARHIVEIDINVDFNRAAPAMMFHEEQPGIPALNSYVFSTSILVGGLILTMYFTKNPEGIWCVYNYIEQNFQNVFPIQAGINIQAQLQNQIILNCIPAENFRLLGINNIRIPEPMIIANNKNNHDNKPNQNDENDQNPHRPRLAII